MSLQCDICVDIYYVLFSAYILLFILVTSEILQERFIYSIFASISCWILCAISFLFSWRVFDLKVLIFGSLLSSALNGPAHQELLYYAYCCTCVSASLISCFALVIQNSSYDEVIFSVFPIFMAFFYSQSISTHGLHSGWIFSFAYIIIFHIAFRKIMNSTFNRKLIVDLGIHCIFFLFSVALFIPISYCFKAEIVFFTADSMIVMLFFGHYYFITPSLFKFYEDYIISRKNLNRRSNYPKSLHLKAIFYFLGCFLILLLIEVAMMLASVHLVFVLVLIHGYSSLMLIGYAIYHEQINVLNWKHKLSYFLQCLLTIYTLKNLIYPISFSINLF